MDDLEPEGAWWGVEAAAWGVAWLVLAAVGGAAMWAVLVVLDWWGRC
jgi:hypothetical protein